MAYSKSSLVLAKIYQQRHPNEPHPNNGIVDPQRIPFHCSSFATWKIVTNEA